MIFFNFPQLGDSLETIRSWALGLSSMVKSFGIGWKDFAPEVRIATGSTVSITRTSYARIIKIPLFNIVFFRLRLDLLTGGAATPRIYIRLPNGFTGSRGGYTGPITFNSFSVWTSDALSDYAGIAYFGNDDWISVEKHGLANFAVGDVYIIINGFFEIDN